MGKSYHSFSEIDRDLQLLKLRREIAAENLKLKLHGARQGLSPLRLLGGAKGVLQKLALTYALKTLSRVPGMLRAARSGNKNLQEPHWD